MEQHHRQLINQYMEDLSRVTYDVQIVVDKLYEKNVINSWMRDYILDSLLTEKEKSKRLYELIQGRGPLAFNVLCKTLDETQNNPARSLLKATKNIKVDVINNSLRIINLNNGRNEPYIKIHPDRKRMDVNDESASTTGVYHMGSNPKGYAFILNINKTVGRDERHGSNVDLESLNKLFKGLGYAVQSEVDLTRTETIEAIEKFIDNCQYKNIDSIVVFIMSHGEAGKDSTRSSDILTADGNKINTDWLIEQFGSDKISKNIPKLFFLQACRGEKGDFGRSSAHIHNNVLQNDGPDSSLGSASSSVGSIMNRRYENVFIAYATVPGYNAKRHPINGSWFVQTLCKVFRNNAWEHDIDSMMKIVDHLIRALNCSINGFQTVEWTYRGFNKKFYFNPGLYDDNSSIDVQQIL